MAAQEIDNPAAPAIAAFTTLLEEFLSQAETAKPTSAIEPALRKSDFDDVSGRVSRTVDDVSSTAVQGAASTINKGRQFAIIETAARNIFSQLIVNPHSPVRSAPCADQNRRQPPSILPTMSRCGTSSTSCRFSPTMDNVIPRSCSG